jgi:hypothetical protein
LKILVSGATAVVRQLSRQFPDYLGVLHTPQNGNRLCAIPLPWAVDNAAFSNPDDDKFWRLCANSWGMENYHPPLWVAVPDIVGDHSETRRLFGIWRHYWLEEIGRIPFRLAFVLQNGCTVDEVPWDEIAAVFVGGDNDFKLRQSAPLIDAAKDRCKLVHIGRVNTHRRLRYAYDLGADTVDGTSYSMFSETHLESAIRFVQHLEKRPVLF